MKRFMIFVLFVLAVAASCSTAKQFVSDNNQTLVRAATYYSQFSAGVKAALPTLALIPGAAPYVEAATIAQGLLDEGVSALTYSANLAASGLPTDQSAVETQKHNVYALVQTINAIVGKVQALSQANQG